MPADTSVLDIAKIVYKEEYDALNQGNWFLSIIEQNRDAMTGLVAKHNVHLRRSSGVGAMGENDNLPTAGNQGNKTLTVPMRMLAGRVRITLAAMKLLGGGDASFVDATTQEMDGNRADLLRDVSRQLWGTSNGVIATCGTTTTSATIVLATTTSAVQMRQLWNDGGMVVDIGTVANPIVVAQARTVTGYSESAKTITISGATVSTTAGTHFVFRTNGGGASAHTGVFGDGQKELTGMQTIVSDTATLHAVTVASETQWKARVFGNSGTLRDPSEPLINNAIAKTSIDTGLTPEFLVCGDEVLQNIGLMYTQMKRIQETTVLPGGWSGIKWNSPTIGNLKGAENITVMGDYDCPASKLFGFRSDSFTWYMHPDGFDYMSDDGSVMSRVTDKAAYEATIVGFCELAANKRRDTFLIDDLAGITA